MLHRRVKKPLDAGKVDDGIKYALYIVFFATKHCGIQEDVFATGEFRMETGTNFE